MFFNQRDAGFTEVQSIKPGTHSISHEIPQNALTPTFKILEDDKKVYYQGQEASFLTNGRIKVTYTFYSAEANPVEVELSYA